MTRNNRTLLATLAIAAFGAFGSTAYAQEATSDAWMQQASTETRAQVVAELQQARANGEMRAYQPGYIEPAHSVETRAQVKADLREAIASGEYARINAEVPRAPNPYLSAPAATQLASAQR